MKYFILIGFFVFLSIIQSNAQSDFRTGYIINNNNDTINGLIDYRGNHANAKKCIFKKDINSEIQTFTPEEIKAYHFTDSKYYVSKSVKTENETKQLFLEYLINGIVDIYYYRDNGEHYLVNVEHGLYELKTKESYVTEDNRSYRVQKKEYVGILKILFSKSPSISKRVETIKLDHKSLIKIAHDYHNEVCTDRECIIYEKKISKMKKSFGIVVGMNGLSFSQTSKPADNIYYMDNSQFGLNIFPSIGLYYKLNLPEFNERIYFQYEGTYSRVHLTTHNSYIEPLYDMNFSSYISSTQHIFNNLGYVRYEFPKGKLRPTFQLGGFVSYFFKADYSRYLEVRNFLGNTTYTDYKNDSPFSNLNFGVNLGIGLGINYFHNKELQLDLRYQRGFGWLNDFNTNAFIINADFQIGR